jgi:hypothetical protein
MVDKNISGDLEDPGSEFVFQFITPPVFYKPEKHGLHQILAYLSVETYSQEVVIDHRTVTIIKFRGQIQITLFHL